MVNPNREPLKDAVEIDESYIGGPEEGQRGRGAAGKAIMICAAEKVGRSIGRIRLGIIEQASQEKITSFLKGRVEVGTTAHTDGWRGYNSLERSGFRHIATSIKASTEKAHIVLPRVHLVFSLVKRWINGTHQGSVSTKHLCAYLEEFTFRFNRRNAKSITHFFQRLAEGLVREKCKPYWKIVGRVAPDRSLRMAA
jgi:transposase-like protein